MEDHNARFTRWEDRPKSQKCKIIAILVGLFIFVAAIVTVLAYFCVYKPE